MKLDELLLKRSENKCEICNSKGNLTLYIVPPHRVSSEENSIITCDVCLSQIEKRTELDFRHWRCLSGSMWSEVPAVQVLSWQMLKRLINNGSPDLEGNEDLSLWAQDQLDMMYLDEELAEWARAGAEDEDDESVTEDVHKDANDAILQTGDSVVLTKSLDVKGSSLNAKMGTVVKNIRLVENNTDQIEGKIDGQVIVILTKYVRKQGA
jgi:protein PhnA